jgi:2-hydroxycyclohexanecarboxyl-CoA dehydrogenase
MTETKTIHVSEISDSAILIIGGTAGVGLATARRFARAGAKHVCIVGRTAARGEQARELLAQEHPATQVHYIQADANTAEEALRIATLARENMGRIDTLVNSTVGSFGPMLFHKIPIQDVPEILNQQIMAPLLMCRAVMEHMQANNGGAIINIASDAGKLATPGESIIGAAMAGIIMFTRGLALEAKRSGIRVNVLTPSLIEGTLTYERIRNDAFSWRIFEKAASMAHLGVVQPDDLAEMILYLASPSGSRITGQAISINGGISAA